MKEEHKLEDLGVDTETDLKEIRRKSVDWINVDDDKDH
jgi:hypothetical protein